MITFRKITKRNLWDVVKLNAGKEGNKHVALNSHTLLEAVFDNKLSGVRAIYNNNNLIGLTYFYLNKNTVWISRFMIDEKCQGKGYGSKSFLVLLKYLKNTYSPKKIELSTSNPIAMDLYKKCDFIEIKNKRAVEFYKKFKERILTLNLE